jgi:glycosyltransferase A (GT-A) superfamily protein (DUF2064 family)
VITSLLVIAKEPLPGRVKTRLVPPLSFDEAAFVARAALLDSLEVASQVPARHHVLVLDGSAGDWIPGGWEVRPQVPGGLDRRLGAALADATPGPVLLIGMDTPQVTSDQLMTFDPEHYQAGLGLAADGGFWAIGLRDGRLGPGLITGVPMSQADTGRRQLARMHAAGLSVQMFAEMTDVDDVGSALSVAREIPESRFARALADALAVC